VRKIIICLAFLSLIVPFGRVSADTAGRIETVSGKVYYALATSPRLEEVEQTPMSVDFGTRVQAKRSSSAGLVLVSGDRIVLEERSSLIIHEQESWTAEQGTVLFDIKKLGGARGLKVIANAVTIGVKGTRFAVSKDEDGKVSVLLQEGELHLSSSEPEQGFQLRGELKEDYLRRMKEIKDHYDQVKQQVKKNYSEKKQQVAKNYSEKKQQMEKNYRESRERMMQFNVEVINDFKMSAGMAIQVDGNNLSKLDMTPEWEEKFEQLDTF